MDEKQIWQLFKETGEIKYYIIYRNIIKKKVDLSGISESKGSSYR